MTERAAVLALFESRGAASIDHPGGTLLDHLVRVADRLERWEAAHDLVIAGLAHAAYGTDGFDAAPFQLTERELVASVTGQRAEAIVYSYASCDRAYTLGQMGRQQTVSLRDRFTGARTVLTSSELHEFAELTFANELDLVQHSEEFRGDLGAAIAEMFARWSHVVSDAAYEDFGRSRRRAHRPGPLSGRRRDEQLGFPPNRGGLAIVGEPGIARPLVPPDRFPASPAI